MPMSLKILEFLTYLLILLMPILVIYKQNLVGILTGTLLNWVIFVTSDLISFAIRGYPVTAEDWEMWHLVWLPMLMYCLTIFSLSWLGRRVMHWVKLRCNRKSRRTH